MRKVLSLIFGSRWLLPKSLLLIKKVIDDPRIVQICPNHWEVHLLRYTPPKEKQQPPPQIKDQHFYTKRSFVWGYPFQIAFQIGGWQYIAWSTRRLRLEFDEKQKSAPPPEALGWDVLVEWHSEVTVHWKTRGAFFSKNTNFRWASQSERCLLIAGFFQLGFYQDFFVSFLNVWRSIPRVPETPLKKHKNRSGGEFWDQHDIVLNSRHQAFMVPVHIYQHKRMM